MTKIHLLPEGRSFLFVKPYKYEKLIDYMKLIQKNIILRKLFTIVPPEFKHDV